MAAHKHAMIIATVLTAAAVVATACGSGMKTTTSDSSASQASIEQLAARVQRNEMLFAVVNLSALPLHDMDESLAAGKADGKFVPSTRSAVRLFALTDWDAALKDEAQILRGHAADLLKALDDGNVDAAKDPAHQLHEGYHDFADRVWAIVAKDLPPDAGGVPPARNDEATPVASATP